MKIEDLTQDQILAIVQAVKFLEEENQNLKGYIVQLKAQLNIKQSQLKIANNQINNITQDFIVVDASID
jgi:hypothetical protein